VLGLLAPTLVGIVAGLILGGSLSHLLGMRLRWWPAILATFTVEFVMYNPPIDGQAWAIQVGPWIWLASKLVLLAILLANFWPASGTRRWPWLVAAAGVSLNALVIALNNGHMPQAPDAVLAVWGARPLDPSRLHNVAPMQPETLLPWLGDVLPQPAWLPRPNIVSIGDLLLATGVALWVFTAMAPTYAFRKAYIRSSGVTWQPATPDHRRRSG
jgi:hypothetical protein